MSRHLTQSDPNQSLPSLPIKKAALEASVFRDDYFEAFKLTWPLVTQQPLQLNWHIEFLCEEIQKVVERMIAGKPKLYDLIINVPPGTSKSSIVSVALQPWLWSRMPHAQIISASHSKNLADDLSSKSRDIVMSDEYQSWFPDIKLRSDTNVKSNFKNTQGGWRRATSVGAKIVGQHAHIILVDDPLNPMPEKTSSMLKFEAANDYIHQTLSTRVIEKSISPTIMVMQRLHQIDPTGYWLEWKKDRRVKHICLPAEIDKGTVSPPRCKNFYVKGLLDPHRLGKNDIKVLRDSLGNFGSAAQLDQTPIAAGGNMFEVENLLTKENWVRAKDLPPMIKVVRFWDNAATDGSGDETAGPKLGIDANEKLWILDLKVGQWGSAKREAIKLQTAEEDGRFVEIGQEIEGGSSGKDSYRATSRMLAGYKIRGYRAVGSKEIRADTFSRQVNDGNVGMVKAAWNAKLVTQLQYFPAGAHDDIVDGLSGAFTMIFRRRRKARAL